MQCIVAPGDGIVERWLVQEGQPIEKGKPIVILSHSLAAVRLVPGDEASGMILHAVIVAEGAAVSRGRGLPICAYCPLCSPRCS